MDVMAAFNLNLAKIREGAKPGGHDLVGNRPASPGSDGQHRTGDGLEEGHYLLLGQSSPGGVSESGVMPESNALVTGFGSSFYEETGSLWGEVGPGTHPCLDGGFHRSAQGLVGGIETAFGLEGLGQPDWSLLRRFRQGAEPVEEDQTPNDFRYDRCGLCRNGGAHRVP